jgi:hypothetical protein
MNLTEEGWVKIAPPGTDNELWNELTTALHDVVGHPVAQTIAAVMAQPIDVATAMDAAEAIIDAHGTAPQEAPPMANKDIDVMKALNQVHEWIITATDSLTEANQKTEEAVAKAVKEAVEKERAATKADPAEVKQLKTKVAQLEQTIEALERALAERSVSSWM